MVLIKANADSEAGVMPSEQLLTEMTAFNEELAEAGVLLGAEGLHPSSRGARVKLSAGEPVVTDGPFSETKELIAGYWVLQVESLDDAIDWVKRIPNPDNEEAEIEIRQVGESEDFGDALTPEARAAGDRLRARVALRDVNPYVIFDGRCEEAFGFYAQILGGDIESMFPHRGTPAEDHVPEEWLDKIMHASLKVSGGRLMGSDAPPDRFERPQGFSVQLSVAAPDKAESIFEALSDGGSVTMPMEKTFWASRFGMLVDRFGIPWMINCDAPGA
jgi:uncharacterized glyoxalase superfamily protein PhnB